MALWFSIGSKGALIFLQIWGKYSDAAEQGTGLLAAIIVAGSVLLSLFPLMTHVVVSIWIKIDEL